MNKVLVVTSRNVHTTSGELRLIKNRAEALYKNYGIPTDFISIVKPSRLDSPQKEEIKAGGIIEPVIIHFKNPFSVIKVYFSTVKLLKEKMNDNYNFILFSGAGTHLLMKTAHKINSKIKLGINFPVLLNICGGSEGQSINRIWYRFVSKLDNTH